MAERVSTNVRRPIGVTVIALVSLLQGAFGLLLVLALIGVTGVVAMFAGPAGATLGALGILFTLLGLVAASAHIWFGFGALRQKDWAWLLGICASAFSLASAVLDIVFRDAKAGPRLVSVAIPALILMYLLSPGVRASFRR